MPAPGGEHEDGSGVVKPARFDGCLQSGDGPGGVGTLEVFRYVSDSVAWHTEPRHQGVEEVRGRRCGHDKVDFAPAQAQAAQEAPARFLGAVSQAGRVTGLACARQVRAAAPARRRAVGFRNPRLVSALAASMRVPITIRLAVDGEYGDADLDAGGERQQHDTVPGMDPLLLEVLVKRHEQRRGGRVAVLLQVDDDMLRFGSETPDEFLGTRANGPGRGL